MSRVSPEEFVWGWRGWVWRLVLPLVVAVQTVAIIIGWVPGIIAGAVLIVAACVTLVIQYDSSTRYDCGPEGGTRRS